ncbi:MAG: ABC transporter ATP-binding protein [Desulfomonilaceae bacterium]
MEKGISIECVHMTYSGITGTVEALRDVDFDIDPGEFICVVGPSGCGKTTLLNVVAGFLQPTSGRVLMDDREISGPGPDRGVVFQQYAIFPWLTVRENIEFGLKLKNNRGSAGQIREIANYFIDLVGLNQFRDSYPKELSGGMKQRVAIARSYAVNPEVLLMDEPFGALDAQSRQFMQEALLGILAKERKTVIFITHGVEEAAFLSTRVVVMAANPGRIREIIPVNIPYPRDANVKTTPGFIEIRAHVDKVVREEFRKQRNGMQYGRAIDRP